VRILVISRPQFPFPPPEQLPGLVAAFKGWRECYKSMTETFEFFAGGGGGIGIVNVPDEQTFNKMMFEYPLGLISNLEIRPIIDGDIGLAQWEAAIRAQADLMAATKPSR
jgi:hypothetical protein